MEIAVMSDGASHRNGGMCGIGVHIVNVETKEVLQQISEAIGEGTNTFAEYTAFNRGVQAAIQLTTKRYGITKVYLLADSNLVVSQVGGTWKASAEVKELVKEAKHWVELLRRHAEVVIDHIPREYNTEADALSTAATDKAVQKSVEQKYPFLTK